MLEEYIFQRMVVEGELARVLIALAGTGVAAWYDLANNRNVPNNFLYVFLGLAFLSNLVFFQPGVMAYGVAVAMAIFLVGYVFYKMGYIGGADVYVLTAIALLLPAFPSYITVLFNFPVVLSVIITSGVLFAVYFLYYVIVNVALKDGKGRYEYLLLLPPYAILLYFFIATGIFGLAYIITITVLILSSIVFMVYKDSATEKMARKVAVSKVEEEDVAVLELMPALAKKHGIKRLLDRTEIERLKRLRVKEIYVYKELPPFLPFVLVALALSVTVGDLLMFSIRI